MKFESKFNLDDEVFMYYIEYDNCITISKHKVEQIIFDKDGVRYFVSNWCESVDEEYMIHTTDYDVLVSKINEVTSREKKDN